MKNIPFVNLQRQHDNMKDEIYGAIKNVIDRSDFIMGNALTEFEKKFAEFCSTKFAIGVSSGSDALFLSLKALGISKGDEVITQANTYISTVDAIIRCDASPVFVDIKQNTHNIDAACIEAKITKNTKAILPVHLFGQTAPMGQILSLAKKHNLFTVEDACQAHGALHQGKKAGSLGEMGCFSFFPSKNLGAMGDGGMVTTNDEGLAKKLRLLRYYGQSQRDQHVIHGYNGRLDTLQAAILLAKLKHLSHWIEQRRSNAKKYEYFLSDVNEITLPIEDESNMHIYHLYVLRTAHRDELLKHLIAKGIQSKIHYPTPIPAQPCYAYLNISAKDLPNTYKDAKEILSLPIFPELQDSEIHYVCNTIREFFKYKVKN